ncbi:MAG: galactose-1-phosphate uridylyltransferase [Spirochaetaceae bacterium 4572_59]|nr:MAG: galactose-1-phosphate uridylyltransferase [Spirochaetaceae bacterium 4572_59]
MSKIDLQENPHRRYNPLTGEWIKVSPHRTKRPWNGQLEKPVLDKKLEFDPTCYLCPGNERAGGLKNPDYKETFVFKNDFAALLEDTPQGNYKDGDLFQAQTERGLCKVVCFSPRHDLTLSLMEVPQIGGVVRTWQNEYRELGQKDFINHIQIFENRGAVMGCSNPHPHGQIWAEEIIPDIPAKEQENQKNYLKDKGRVLLMDYAEKEMASGKRVIFSNDSFVAVVPFWAVWPYEAMILPLSPLKSIDQMSDKQVTDLSDALKRMGTRFDNLFKTSFPYSMGIHQAPTDGEDHEEWQLHVHYYPPLLRSASVKKFMVGYEMLGMPQRDITAEGSAASLRQCSEEHYTITLGEKQ